MPESYFVTWNRQRDAVTMPVSGAEHDEFILDDGRRIYDFTSTSFQASFGHSCQPIRQRVHEQLDQMPMASPKASFELKTRASQKLLQLIGCGEQASPSGKIFYTVSGSEAVENALKIVRHVSGRKIILARRKSYHGASLGSMSVSGDWRSHPHLNFSEGTVRIPEPEEDPDASRFAEIVRQTGPENIAALIVETISGVNGVAIPAQAWWDAVSRLCRDQGILLICDEVLAGFGRTGPAFAFQQFDLRPDLICMSKGITGGYIPFGGVWVNDRLARHYDDDVLACGLTNYAHPLGLAAMDAVMDLLTDASFMTRKRELEASFATLIEELAGQHPCIRGFRQRGLLAAIDFQTQPPAWQRFFDAGLYLILREQMLILAPPFVSTPARLSDAFQRLHDTLRGESG